MAGNIPPSGPYIRWSPKPTILGYQNYPKCLVQETLHKVKTPPFPLGNLLNQLGTPRIFHTAKLSHGLAVSERPLDGVSNKLAGRRGGDAV